jgi:flavin reductase (DIM6/NTAB) family NADH-FMN oxidoreductase RutF
VGPAENAEKSAADAYEVEVDADAFRRTVGRFATGVTVVTTVVDGVDHAMTASAFHDAVVESGAWGVSVLDATARPAAEWLASRGRPLHGQLDRVPHHRGPVTGCALLDASLATLECRTTDVLAGGDHSIVVGTVVGLGTPQPDGRPLLYFRSGYHSLP